MEWFVVLVAAEFLEILLRMRQEYFDQRRLGNNPPLQAPVFNRQGDGGRGNWLLFQMNRGPKEKLERRDLPSSVRIRNKSSGLYLAVREGSANAGTQIIQWGPTGGAEQNWRLVGCDESEEGWFNIINTNSGLYLAVREGSLNSGTDLIQWGPTGGHEQCWEIYIPGIINTPPGTPQDTGGFIKLRNFNSRKVMAVPESSKNQGSVIIQWDDIVIDDQLWMLEQIG